MRVFVLFVIAVVALAPMGFAEEQTMIGPWNVSVGNDCRIWDQWNNDDKSTAMIGLGYIDKGKSLTLVFGDSRWKLKKNEDLRIALRVDEDWKKDFPGSAINTDKAVAYLLPVSSTALNALMNGRELFMDIKGKGEDYSYVYDLDDDTTRAIAALDACRFETAELGSEKPDATVAKKPTGTLTVTRSVVSLDKGGSSPKTVFSTQTPRIYVSYTISGATESTDAVARIDLLAVKTEVVQPNFRVAKVELKLNVYSKTIHSWFDKPEAGWPAGDYRSDLFIDNKLSDSLRFRIE